MRHLPLVLIALLVGVLVVLLVNADGSDDGSREGSPPAARTVPGDNGRERVPASVAAEPAEGTSVAVEEVLPRSLQAIDPRTKIDRYAVADATVAEAVEEVARRLGCRASFTDAAWERVGPSSSVTLHFEDVSASTVLDMLTEMHGLQWKVVDRTLWVLTEGEEPAGDGR